MAENLPDPASRTESYLAKAAGMDVTIPEQPESRLEKYLDAIAEGGGGGGGTSDFDQLSNRPKYNGATMSSETNIPEVVSYSDFTGTDGTAAGTHGLVPAPATTDVGKFLKADGTWDTAGGGDSSIRELTTDDYNYPADNPDGVAVWLLPLGFYKVPETFKVYWTSSWVSTYLGETPFFGIVDANAAGIPGQKMVFMFNKRVSFYGNWIGTYSYKVSSSGYSSAGASADITGFYLKTQDVYNSIPTTDDPEYYYKPLSANQGRKLSERIQGYKTTAPTTSTAGTVGGIIPTLENGTPHLYMCTAKSGSTYTWTQMI